MTDDERIHLKHGTRVEVLVPDEGIMIGTTDGEPYPQPRVQPELLTAAENRSILHDAEQLWAALEKNELGGFSNGNRPFYILDAFKRVIEKYGKRDVGQTWSKDDLESANPQSWYVDVVWDDTGCCTEGVNVKKIQAIK